MTPLRFELKMITIDFQNFWIGQLFFFFPPDMVRNASQICLYKYSIDQKPSIIINLQVSHHIACKTTSLNFTENSFINFSQLTMASYHNFFIIFILIVVSVPTNGEALKFRRLLFIPGFDSWFVSRSSAQSVASPLPPLPFRENQLFCSRVSESRAHSRNSNPSILSKSTSISYPTKIRLFHSIQVQ